MKRKVCVVAVYRNKTFFFEEKEGSFTPFFESESALFGSAGLKEELNKIDKKSRIFFVFSGEYVITRNISLPTLSGEEIAKMLALQVKNYMPYDENDTAYSYEYYPDSSVNKSDVILYGMKKSFVVDAVELLKACGFSDCCVSAMPLFFSNIAKKLLNGGGSSDSDKAILIVDILDSLVQISICKRVLKYFKTAFFSEPDDLVKNIKNSIELAHNRNLYVSSIYCPSRYEGILRSVESGFHGLAVLPYEDEIGVKGEFLFLEAIKYAADFGRYDFTPENYKFRGFVTAFRKDIIVVLALLSVLSVEIVSGAFLLCRNKERFAGELNKKLGAMTAPDKRVRGRCVDFLYDFYKKRDLPSVLLDAVYDIFPGMAYITSLEYDDGGISISGYSDSYAKVSDIVLKMQKSVFGNVKINYAKKRVMRNKEVVDFKIKAVMKRER